MEVGFSQNVLKFQSCIRAITILHSNSLRYPNSSILWASRQKRPHGHLDRALHPPTPHSRLFLLQAVLGGAPQSLRWRSSRMCQDQRTRPFHFKVQIYSQNYKQLPFQTKNVLKDILVLKNTREERKWVTK